MISTGQIVAAGAITGIGVAISAAAVRWRMSYVFASVAGSFVLIVG